MSTLSTEVPTNIIDGTSISKQIRAEITESVKDLLQAHNTVPGLAVLLVGARPDSLAYVRMKKKACTGAGIASSGYDYDVNVTQAEILTKIEQLNNDDNVHGILIQLPLPPHINEGVVTGAVLPSKDVDGLHPLNAAALVVTGTKLNWENLTSLPFHVACTPQGIIELLDRSSVTISGKNAVVLGRSNLVGLPVSMLLMHRNATVTICHSKTQDIESIVKQADIVIAAVGSPYMVKGHWLKAGCAVIDVGINSLDDPSSKKGYKLVGDVDFEEGVKVAGRITPVPGGVGPMTIAMLLRNTVNGARWAAEKKEKEETEK